MFDSIWQMLVVAMASIVTNLTMEFSKDLYRHIKEKVSNFKKNSAGIKKI